MKNLDNPTILQKRLNDSEEDNHFDIQEDLFSLTVLQNLFENGNINNTGIINIQKRFHDY